MLSDLLGINKYVSVSKFVLKYRANIKYMYGIVTEYTSNNEWIQQNTLFFSLFWLFFIC